jgi:hypothetical protein
MKYNNFFIALALCAAMHSGISFGMEEPQQASEVTSQAEELKVQAPQAPENKTYWQQYAPEFMQRGTRYVSEKATNVYNTVNSWSTRKKIAVASAIITALAVVYNREQIMQWVSGLLEQEAPKAQLGGNKQLQQEVPSDIIIKPDIIKPEQEKLLQSLITAINAYPVYLEDLKQAKAEGNFDQIDLMDKKAYHTKRQIEYLEEQAIEMGIKKEVLDAIHAAMTY